ncbi:hypothetical protein HH310_01935 [Actinoplanes sp. TBRC 11911]|uniref:fibronectin type III domain-containing protein n=1 Tax=Actinoplanes sp. TBRC 11911 TaxID=2729386 RepID=UPI00145D35E6|nr:fibronectin type III domain-containing protein [Actinoplanes sp. TBRC 11911]NMO49956.1 hypothetical protein [Actinoplanes sp. TBRC 11911]
MPGRHRQASGRRHRRFRWRSALLGLLLAAGWLCVVPAPVAAASPCTTGTTPVLGDLVTCSAVGNVKLGIPVGATRAVVSVAGAGGAANSAVPAALAGGRGKLIQGTITWPAGTSSLSVWTGGGYSASVTAQGGDGSGIIAVGPGVLSKLVIAGGGGGAGTDAANAGNTGKGGDADTVGGGPLGGSPGAAGAGGAGGGSVLPLNGGSYPGTADAATDSIAAGGAGASVALSTWKAGGGGGGYGGGGGGGLVVVGVLTSGGGGGGSWTSPQYMTTTSVGTQANGGVVGGAAGANNGSVSLTFFGVPGTPTVGTATAGDQSATVAFNAPASTGGSAITGYTATASPGGRTGTCSSSPCTVTGLTNGVSYTFTIHATNAAGDSAESSGSNAVTPFGLPGAPTAVSATAGNTQAAVSFTAPASNGGAAITGYTATASPGGATGTCASSPCTVTGLTNGVSYTFSVHATNAAGNSAESAASSGVTPVAVPGVPTAVSAVAGNAQAVVSFTAPASNGGTAITGYTATASPGGATGTCASSPCTVTGLTNGVSYAFTVHATNAVGNSSESTASSSVTAVTAPGVPTSVSAVAGNAQAVVSFTAPASNGGTAITGYTATASPGGATGTCASSPCTVTGLTNGVSYTFTVHATNAAGSSAESAASAAVIQPVAPGQPTGVSAVAGNAQVAVSFTAPVSNGGAAITGYTATASPGGATGTCASSPCTVTGLTNGVSYTFSVHATNAAGSSAESAASAAVTPVAVPGPPTAVSAVAGNTQAAVSFTAPASTGGTAITGYTATATPGGRTGTCASSPCTVTGLTNGTGYTFTVHATNAVGDSAESSASGAVTPATAPGAPTAVSAAAGNAQAAVSFTAPASNGGAAVTGYTATASPGGGTGTCTGSPCTVTGLTNGVSYTFTVHATNVAGSSAESAASAAVTPDVVPNAPAIGVAIRGNQSATVSFTAPASNGGTAVTGYTATALPGGATGTCVSSPCTVTGLTNGTAYTFTVHATNAAGVSAESAASNAVTPASAPGAPTVVSASAGNAQATVSFIAPVSHGGAAVTGYTATASPGGVTGTCTGSPCTVTGLTNGVAYTFTVHATNSVGSSAESSASASVTPDVLQNAPTVGVAVGGNQSATVSFTAPASNGGTAITGYTATALPGGATGTCASSPCTVTGLTNGTSYTFTVHATNAAGASAESAASNAVTPAAAPGAPTAVSAGAGNAQAAVSFTAPPNNGATITGYTATSTPGNKTGTCTSSPCTVTGLTNGIAYTFTVHATNSAGNSAESSASSSVTPDVQQNAPTISVATGGNQSATISFTAPLSNGGTAITGYTATASPGGATGTCASSPCTVTGLTNGTSYTFTVHATNAAGVSAESAASNAVTPAAAPGVPTAVSASGGNAQATVSFTAPASNGGATITGYTATSTLGSVTGTCVSSPCTVTGLTNGVAYTFTVHATNSAGSSAESSASASVTPDVRQNAPTIGVAAAGDRSATVAFTAPAANGGTAITGYTATSTPGNVTGTCASSPCTVTGLTNGTAYTFTVHATNGAGNSAESAATTAVTPDVRPNAPTVGLAVRANQSATVSFTAPASNGGTAITGYTATASPGGATGTCSSSPCAVTGLTNGTSYTFTVHASNAAGDSAESAVSNAVTPAAAPGPPTGLSATAGDAQAAITFAAPANNGGAAITGYTATSTPGNVTGTCTSSPCTVTGLTNGVVYTFTVHATNSAGSSAESAATTAVTPDVRPNAATIGTAIGANQSATVSFTAPASNGGTAITGYTATSTPGNATGTCASSPCTVTGLTNGTAYTFTVHATNAAGDSAESAASNTVTPAAAPGAPTAVSAAAGNAQATVSFTAPATNGGATITGYTVTSTPDNETGSCTASPCTITGLTNGTSYTFTVHATNSAGNSAESSASAAVTPDVVPNAPAIGVAIRGNQSATVSFTAPASNGGTAITGYTATSTPGNMTGTCLSSPCTVTGLTNGTAYTFTVHATNADGDSTESTASNAVTPAAAPGPPTAVSATAGNAQATVTFTAPPNNGATITGYTATSTPDGRTGVCTASPCTVTGLTNGTAYTFTVHATNIAGDSSESSASPPVTPDVRHNAPTIGTAVRGDRSATVAFTAPASNGGTAITGYTATSTPGNVTGTCASSPCTVTGLTNGTSYTFTVHASNTAGNSAESAASNAVTPADAPDAPTAVSATAGDTAATVSFGAPANNGATITGYTATSTPDNKTGTCTSSPCTVTGLTNGTAYTFTVHATNSAGSSTESSASPAVTPDVTPDAPAIGTATRGNRSATVAFTAPPSNGGTAITGYTATSTPGNVTGTCTSSPCTVTGLTNGTAYTFTVHASNAAGDSPESAASHTVTPATAPDSPTAVSATAGDAQATVTFTAPADDGGATITGFTATSTPDGRTGTCSSSPCIVTGLANGIAHTFTVHATNSAGNSAESAASAAVTPIGSPNPPVITGVTAGNASATIAFTPHAVTGGGTITGFTATSTPDSKTGSCTASPCTITGLTNGTAYTFTVHATGSGGTSGESVASSPVTPSTTPGTPAVDTVTEGDRQVSVAFTAAGDGGAAVTGFTVTSDPEGHTATCASSPCVVGGLANGTAYTFTVHATNGNGSSAESSPSWVATPAVSPDAPTIGAVTERNARVDVAFTAPADDGGAAISGYTVTASPGGRTGTCVSSPCTITGLTNGTGYTFTVHATNRKGDSGESASSATVTPATIPDPPVIGTPWRGDTQAQVDFTAPADDGGAAITGYTATASPGGRTATCVSSPCTVTGLTNGTGYTFTVTASNLAGTSAPSAMSSSITPAAVPDAPVIGAVTAGNARAVVAFTPSASPGGSPITGYTAVSSPGNFRGTCASSPCTVTGLSNGTPYTFHVYATNGVGDSLPSSWSSAETPATTPDAPTIGAVTRGDQEVSVAFTGPADDGGAVVTGFTALSNPDGRTAHCWSSPCLVTGLTNGVGYTFTVWATNRVGDSPVSAASATVVPAAAPGVPTGVSASAGNGRADVSFAAPADNGGLIVSGYTVTAAPGGLTAQCPSSPCTVTGLANGTGYTFTVRATNAVGSSGESAASPTVTPATVPDAPVIGTPARGGAEVRVAFTAPADDGGASITGYTAVSAPDGRTGTCSSSPCLVAGLTNGTGYTFRVYATNRVGDSSLSVASASVTPAAVPGAPTISAVTGGDARADVSFVAPANVGGSPITGYTAVADPGGRSGTCVVSPCAVTGLTNGVAYTFTVYATNGVGDSLPSAASSPPVTPARAPDAPVIGAVTRGDRQVSVAFGAPPSDGGASITAYTVESSPGGHTGSCAASPCTVTGLTNGTTYTFSVTATNSAGTSPPSSASASVTPAVVPGAPAIGTAVASDGRADVSFTAPADSGGLTITGYTAVASPGGRTGTCTASPCTVTGLTNGTAYTFAVYATTGAGDSPLSAFTSPAVTPATVPDAPLIGAVTRGDRQVVVAFVPPLDDGGAPITGYTAVASPGNRIGSCAASPCTVTGLTNGTNYTFTVYATNRVGDSLASGMSASATPAAVPGAPVIGVATPGDARAEVSFVAPVSTGGSSLTGYTAVADPGGRTGTCVSSPCVVTGLSNGTGYTFTVFASNAVGDSPPSAATAQIVPVTVPAAPTIGSAAAGNARAEVSFVAPVSTGGSSLTGYTAVADPGGRTGTCVSSPCVVTGLANGTEYTFTVFASNAVGDSLPSAATAPVIPATVPGAPVIGAATAGNARAQVSFVAPVSTGGSAIVGYTAVADPGGRTGTCASSPCVVTGLANGTEYTFAVFATNAVGDSAPSAATGPVTPMTVPGAPTIGSAAAGNARAEVSFLAPASTGGAPITGYTAVADSGGRIGTCASSPCVVTGLANGTEYTFAVFATNAAGDSPPSAATAPVVPATVPGAPTIVAVTARDGAADVAFAAPASNGGAPVTAYTVMSSPDGRTGICASSPCAVTGLTNGTTYRFTAHATNRVGDSLESAISDDVTPVGVPQPSPSPSSAPSVTPSPIESPSSSPTVVPSPTAAAPSPSVSSSTVVPSLTPAAPSWPPASSSTTVVPSLTAAASPSPAPVLPAAPAAPVAAAGISSVTVTWAASDDRAVTGYLVVASPGPATCATSRTTCVIGAVAGVRYTYTVIARALTGDSRPSAPSNSVIAVAPTSPPLVPGTALSLTTDHGDLPVIQPGGSFVVLGSGYARYSTVTLTAYSTPIPLGRATTSDQGRFAKEVTLPLSFSGARHSLVAQGAAPDGTLRTMKVTLTVLAPVTHMPVTGAPIVWLTATAMLAVAVGLTLRQFGAGPDRRAARPGRHRAMP